MAFETHFLFHENGGPFPGSCLRCGNNKKLWQVGTIPSSNMTALVCDKCITELATFAGFVTQKVHNDYVATAEKTTEELKAKVDATPKLMEKFTHDITSTIGNFVTSLSGITVPNKPVQPESIEASAGSVSGNDKSKHPVGEPKGKAAHPSSKPFVK